jgi:type III secretion protein V
MQAAKIYTLLSIGGGLVSQVPSLLVSLTAGIITTRVSSDKADANLGSDISSQILSHPKALFISSGVLFILSLIPVFPWFVFLPLSLLIGGTGIKKMLDEKKARGVVRSADGSSMAIEGGEDHALVKGGTTQFALTLPVILEVGKFGSQLMKERKGAEFVELMVPKMRAALYSDLGVRFPGVHVRTNAPNLQDDEYMIYLNEVPMEKGMLVEGKVLTNESAENLKRYNIPYTTFKSILNQNSYWVENRFIEILKKAGIKYWDSLDVMILHLSYFYKKNASEFLGIQEVRSILEFIEKSFPDLAKEVTRLVPLQKLTEIFKRLIQEQISIKDLRTILEALSEWSQMEKDTVLLTEYVRSSLKRYISYKYSQGQTTLAVYMLDPEIEEIVRGAIKQTSGGTYLTLDPDSAQLILQALRSAYIPPPPGGQQPVVLTSMDIRRFVRKLIEGEFPDLAVLSTHEIIPEIRIQPLGRIQLS